KVPKQSINHNPVAIDDDTYQRILAALSKENGIKHFDEGVKKERQMWRPWLRSGIVGTRLTGFRRESLLQVRMRDIHENPDKLFIKIQNYKVNKMKNLQGDS